MKGKCIMGKLKVLAIISFLSSIVMAQERIKLGSYKFDNGSGLSSIVYRSVSDSIVYFKADFDLDADGSPRAYNPTNTGINHNDNGRNVKTKKWFAIAMKNDSVPFIQNKECPYPGNYISTTSLELKDYTTGDYRRYVDSERIPYIVLPGGKYAEYKKMGMKLGDITLVYNLSNDKYTFAIFADIGPAGIIGEGSIKLAENLGIHTYMDKKGRIRGGEDKGNILYILLPKSGYKKYSNITTELIDSLGNNAIKLKGDLKILVSKLNK